jgi:hypothetical protein
MNRALTLVKLDHKPIFGLSALFSGLLSLLLVAVSLQGPTAPGAYLEFFNQHRAAHILTAILFMTWAVIAILFLAAVEQLLRPRGEVLARAATLLSSLGILLLAFGYFTTIGAFMAISAIASAPLPAEPEYQAAIWRNMGFFLSDPGLMAWGLGFFLLGMLTWNSGVLPRWLGIVALVGGAAGLLTLAVYQTPVLALVQVSCFTVWGFAVGARIFRSPAPDFRE